MIRGVELRNWRSHEQSRFEFAKGTNILVGIMGSGKSSVVDGICFALFGTFPALQARKVKLQELVRRGGERGGAKVSVTFDVGGEEYEAIRTINEKGGGEGELRKKGGLIEGPQSKRVTEKIEELLGIDYELFARAVYSEQNGIDYFLELGRGQRKKQIDELMGIDRFEDARTEASRVINRLREMAKDRRGAVGEEEEKRAKGELEKAVGEMGKLETETNGIESDVLKAKVRKENVEKEFRLIEKKKSELEMLERKKASFEGILEKLKAIGIGVAREKAEIADEIEVRRKETAKAGEEASLNRDSISKIEGELGKCRSKLDDARGKAEKRKKLLGEIGGRDVGAIERKNELAKNEIEKIRDGISKNNAELENLRNSLSELESAGAECPVCESKLDEARKRELREKRGKKVGDIEARVGELKSKLVEFGIKAKDCERELQNLRDANSKLAALEVREEDEKNLGEKLALLETERKKLSGERELIEKKKRSLDEELRKFERELEGAEAREGLEGVAKSIALLN
ncbi:MAG: SMC family ATPase, partial [Candidatus Micrarchaeota archaeon]|nr:SMC family ATPase [Candidatus Micrarchaeota archaeon]